MSQTSLSFKLGENGKRNALLINPDYMKRNAFVICGLVAALVKNQKDILTAKEGDVYYYALETLHRTPAERLTYIEAQALSQRISQNKFEITLELNTAKKSPDDIDDATKHQRKAAKPSPTKKLKKASDPRYGKFGDRMIPAVEPVKDNDAANAALAKDREFTYAEFQALAAYENRTIGEPRLSEISTALGNCLRANGSKLLITKYTLDRKLDVENRRTEILAKLDR